MTFQAKKNIIRAICTLCLLSWVAFLELYYFYFQNVAPRNPDFVTGQIYEVNDHGYIFYLTKKQIIIAFIPCFVAISSFAVGFILEFRWKIYKKIYGVWPKPW